MDGYAHSPNAYQEVAYGSSLDLLTAASMATAVHSVSTFSIIPELWHFRMLTYFVSIALDHGPTASSLHSMF